MDDDAILLSRYVETRSESAFGELVKRHIGLVYSVALRQVGGDAHLAQDVAQTVFTALARKALELRKRDAVGGWLYRTTQFAAGDRVRAERRRRAREQEACAMQETMADSEPPPDWEKLRPLLDEAIGELGDSDRDAICLRYFENRPYAEIGQRLRLSENSARMRVQRALDKLNGLLARRGVTSTTAALAIALPGQATALPPISLVATVTQTALLNLGAITSGGLAWAVLVSMKSTKVVLGLAIAVSIGAVGTTLYVRDDSQKRLAAAREENIASGKRIADLEQALSRLTPTDVADAAVPAAANAAASPTTTAQSSQADRAEEAITNDSVHARLNRARELGRNGRHEEALMEYLWCYDIGTLKFSHLAGVRGALPREIARLGQQYPLALDALRLRRDRAEQRLLAGDTDHAVASQLASINEALGESNRTLSLYDAFPPSDPRRQTLDLFVYDQLADAQRYQEAAHVRSYNQMSSHFEMFVNRTPAAPDDTTRTRQHHYAVNVAAKNIEVLAAIGDLEHAIELALRVLEYDNSSQTRMLLEKHLGRAGQPTLIANLPAPGP